MTDNASIRVLAVDDSPMILKLVKMTLESQDHWQVDTAESPDRAQEKWAQAHYDLLIVDFNMPGATGLELIEQLQPPASPTLPIIMLSADNGDDLKQQARRLNVTGWMHKPFQPQSLIKVAQTTLKAEHPELITEDSVHLI
jgi:CheY-like chemotaxis protein